MTTTHKTKMVKIAVAVLLLLLICTVASRTVYSLLLPRVTAQMVKKGTLTYTAHFTGEMTGKTDNNDVLAGDNWKIKEVPVEDDQMVAEGDVLFVLDVQEYRIRIGQLDANIQQKKNAINGADWTGGDRLVLEMELKNMEMQRAQAYNQFPQNGKVLAPVAGMVSGVVKPGVFSTGTVLASVSTGAGAGDTALEWRVPPAQAKQVLLPGVSLACEFDLLTDTAGFVLKEIKTTAQMQSAEYDKEAGEYVLRAVLQSEAAVPVATPVQITAVATSAAYPLLVPISCVLTDSNGENYVMTLIESSDIWGLVTQVQKVPVEVVESDAQHAAVEAQNGGLYDKSRLAAYPSRTLSDGETVRVERT